MDASAFRGIGDAVAAAIFWLAVIACVAVPLAIWKAIEIVVWLARHVSVSLA